MVHVTVVPAPASLIAPAVAVRLTSPVVDTLPALSVTSRPALAVIAPEVLLTFAFTSTSLLAPVAWRMFSTDSLSCRPS